MVRRGVIAVIVVALGAALTIAVAGVGEGGRSISEADRSFVVVLARHVRHEAALAGAAAARATDPSGRDLAADVTRRASSRADALDGVLRDWRVTDDAAAGLFAVATADIPVIKGVPVFACSLQHRPVDDLGQIDAAAPSAVSARWAQLAMTSAIEGLNLSKTADGLLGAAREIAAANDRWHRDVLAGLAPLLPETDRAMVRRAQQP